VETTNFGEDHSYASETGLG